MAISRSLGLLAALTCLQEADAAPLHVPLPVAARTAVYTVPAAGEVMLVTDEVLSLVGPAEGWCRVVVDMKGGRAWWVFELVGVPGIHRCRAGSLRSPRLRVTANDRPPSGSVSGEYRCGYRVELTDSWDLPNGDVMVQGRLLGERCAVPFPGPPLPIFVPVWDSGLGAPGAPKLPQTPEP